MTAVTFLTADPLGSRLAGPAIRALELARVLAGRGHDVRVVSTGSVDTTGFAVPVASIRPGRVPDLGRAPGVVVVGGDLLARHPGLAGGAARVVVDLYDPYHLEALERTVDLSPHHRELAVAAAVRSMRTSSLLGDWFMCASQRQRDLWIGQLAVTGRVNPATYDADPSLDGLIGVVPFGVPDAAPAAQPGALRSVLPELGDDDVLWWGGGMYNWFDPALVVRAVARLRDLRPDRPVHLVLAGSRHPHPEASSGRAEAAARRASDELGLTGTLVHFLDAWVPYAERAGHLADAALGVCAAPDHVETRFSFRTRLLDHLWCGLPTVTTAGDELGARIAQAGAGWVVDGDADAFAAAVAHALDDDEGLIRAGDRARALAAELRWEVVSQPLLQYCSNPSVAVDLRGRRRRAQILHARSLDAYDDARRWGTAVRRRLSPRPIHDAAPAPRSAER